MLQFDRQTSSFILDGAVLGPSTRPQDLAANLSGELSDVTGHPGWVNFTARKQPIALFAAFKDGLVHSGHFWSNTFNANDWSEAERVEAQRREAHQEIMYRLFDADFYEDARIKVDLVRDPRVYLEIISFSFFGR